MSRIWFLVPLLLLLSACGDGPDTPTSWQDVALWAVGGLTLVGITWAERSRR
jgi:hypothetical protein